MLPDRKEVTPAERIVSTTFKSWIPVGLFDWTGDYSATQTQQLIVNMRVSRTYSLLPQAIGVTVVLSGQRELSRPNHDVTEGILTLAEDKRPEATLLIGLS